MLPTPALSENMRSILLDHMRRYPEWEVADLYKLLHQAAMGAEHAIKDQAGARDWLLTELAALGDGPGEPLIDPISPDGEVVRVHLRPFAARRLMPEFLLQAFIQTARFFHPSIENLENYCSLAVQLARAGSLPFDAGGINKYFVQMRLAHFPAAHHSGRFAQFYHPAYRVVRRSLLPGEILQAAQRQPRW